MSNHNSSSVSLSIVSHGQGKLVFNLLSDINRLNLLNSDTDKVILTLNIPESNNFSDLFPELPINLISNSTPKGFGANHNSAFLYAETDYFVVLNPDVRLAEFNLKDMLGYLKDSNIGVMAPLVYSTNGKIEDSARKFPTLHGLFARFFLKQRSPEYIINKTPFNVDWVAGMFMVFHSEFFKFLGGFDERYFMYMEDADICYRANKSGKSVVVNPYFEIIHDAQRNSHRNLKYMFWHIKSALRYLMTNN